MARAPRLAAALAVLFAHACAYSPALTDCAVKCSDDGSCPRAMECQGTFCRPPGATGACDCIPGEQRACGGGKGECTAGNQSCRDTATWGACVGEVRPTAELCDNKDNDCDGTVDNDPTDTPPCDKTLGVCAGKVQRCVDGAYSGTCGPAEYGPTFDPVETRCDGLDNDCDGVVDGTVVRRLLDSIAGLDFVGFDGGYGLAWTRLTGTTGRTINARLFDAAMRPLGPALTLGTTSNQASVAVASYGGRVWFVWQNLTNFTESGGAWLDATSPAAVQPLTGFPVPGSSDGVRVGANARGLVGAASIDGGTAIIEWPSDGGAPTTRFVTFVVLGDPLQALIFGPAHVDVVTPTVISNHAGAVSVTGSYSYGDAGAGIAFDAVISLNDANLSTKFVQTSSVMLDTPTTVQEIYSGSCNLAGICVKSYVAADFDVFSAAVNPVEVRFSGDPMAITGTHATSTTTDWVASWIEKGQLFMGTRVVGTSTLRTRNVALDGGLSLGTRIGNAGGPMAAVVVLSFSGGANLDSVLLCMP